MVKRYSKDGFPYREPPYNREELAEIEKTAYSAPKAHPSFGQGLKHRSKAKPPAE